MKKHLLICCCLLGLFSCASKPSEAEQREALEAQVLAVHDAAMAHMDQIYTLRQNLGKLRDTLQTRPADTAAQSLLTRHITLLQQADDAMMNWMHQYRAPEKDQAPAEAAKYLQQELQKMEQVKKQMDSTVAAAQQIYKQHVPEK